jgi:hypothetical protein
VQNADSSTLFDDLDNALQRGPAEKTRGHTGASLLRCARPHLKIDFNKLSTPNAPRLLRFGQAREVSARSA